MVRDVLLARPRLVMPTDYCMIFSLNPIAVSSANTYSSTSNGPLVDDRGRDATFDGEQLLSFPAGLVRYVGLWKGMGM